MEPCEFCEKKHSRKLYKTELLKIHTAKTTIERILEGYRERNHLTGYEVDGVFDGLYGASNGIRAALRAHNRA